MNIYIKLNKTKRQKIDLYSMKNRIHWLVSLWSTSGLLLLLLSKLQVDKLVIQYRICFLREESEYNHFHPNFDLNRISERTSMFDLFNA